jgi:hypothetical protein
MKHKKSKLPITLQESIKRSNILNQNEKQKKGISFKSINTTKLTPSYHYKPISKIVDFEKIE